MTADAEASPDNRSRFVADWRAVGAMTIFVVALATMTLHLPGAYVADARLEHVLAPRQFLARHLHAWDDVRGAGAPASYFSPVVSAMQSVLDVFGLAPWLIGRITLTVYLTIAGCGAMLLAARLQPLRRWMPVASGLLYAFNPFTSQFLIPSGLFVPAAALPWLLLFAYDGLRTRDPWRHAARFALVVFAVGMLNTASLLFSLLPVAVFALFVVIVEREARWTELVSFAWRTAVLTMLVSAAMLTILTGAVATLSRVVSTTELPSTVAQTSSASESWRGLGFWLTYFRFGRAQRPGAEPFFASPWVIMLTYVPLALALAGAVSRSVRLWRAWLGVMSIGVLIMTGAHRSGETPLSSLLGWLFDDVASARAMRTTYKAGTGVALATAMLAPAGAVHLKNVIARGLGVSAGRSRVVLGAGVFTVAGLAGALPFAGGWLFNEADTYRKHPGYWDDFFEVMSAYPDDRVLVFPGVSRHRYDWGFVNDNLFDARLAPAAVYAQTVSGSTASYTAAIEEIDARLTADDLHPAAFAPVLRRLGVRWVLVQRDLADLDIDLPQRLRAAPGLTLHSAFGALSDGTPALELYEVDGPDPMDALWSTEPPVLVSGGEGVLVNLVRAGWVDSPMVNVTALDESTLDLLLSAGAEVVVTDGAQRRATRLGVRGSRSVVMSEAVQPYRPILTTRPNDASTQTVLDTGQVTIVAGARFEQSDQWNAGGQPGLLFDANIESGWQMTQTISSAVGREVSIQLARPALIESMVVSPLTSVAQRVTQVRVGLSGPGVSETLDARLDPEAPTRIGIQRRVDEITITVTGTSASQGTVGLAELQLVAAGGPLDTLSSLRVPDEITRFGLEQSGTPISYVFGRLGSNEETVLRRRFTTVRAQTFEVSAQVQLQAPVDAGDRDCAELFAIDGRPVPVRPVAGRTWAGLVVPVEGCRRIALDAGAHVLEETASDDQPLAVVKLRDVRSPGPSDSPSPIAGQRRASSRHVYDVPAGPGLLSTKIPFHRGWRLETADRTSVQLDTFTGTSWLISDGDRWTVAAHYHPQRRYVFAMVTSGLAVLGCGWLAIRRRRS